MGRTGQPSRRRIATVPRSLAGGDGDSQNGSCRVIICAGLKSSGSTWLYNAVIKILEESASPGRARRRRATGQKLLPFYAESIDQFPATAASAETLIIKTHIPSPSLQFLATFLGAATFTTVREPRDAIASLMQRFGHEFRTALREVSAGASRLIELSRASRPFVLRYEDRFFDRQQTVARLAYRLGRPLPAGTVLAIYESLRPERVTQYIRALEEAGAFGRRVTPDSFDSRTHWHPGHVGDRKIGKFDEILTAKMQQTVLQTMRDYCSLFGYPTQARGGAGKKRTMLR